MRSRRRVIEVFFFFQAEDGIRDKLVTGVQTCALPISANDASGRTDGALVRTLPTSALASRAVAGLGSRSGEGRVGEEGRSWWGAGHLKKKKKSKGRAQSAQSQDGVSLMYIDGREQSAA